MLVTSARPPGQAPVSLAGDREHAVIGAAGRVARLAGPDGHLTVVINFAGGDVSEIGLTLVRP